VEVSAGRRETGFSLSVLKTLTGISQRYPVSPYLIFDLENRFRTQLKDGKNIQRYTPQAPYRKLERLFPDYSDLEALGLPH
jgi:hypothetical protein